MTRDSYFERTITSVISLIFKLSLKFIEMQTNKLVIPKIQFFSRLIFNLLFFLDLGLMCRC